MTSNKSLSMFEVAPPGSGKGHVYTPPTDPMATMDSAIDRMAKNKQMRDGIKTMNVMGEEGTPAGQSATSQVAEITASLASLLTAFRESTPENRSDIGDRLLTYMLETKDSDLRKEFEAMKAAVAANAPENTAITLLGTLGQLGVFDKGGEGDGGAGTLKVAMDLAEKLSARNVNPMEGIMMKLIEARLEAPPSAQAAPTTILQLPDGQGSMNIGDLIMLQDANWNRDKDRLEMQNKRDMAQSVKDGFSDLAAAFTAAAQAYQQEEGAAAPDAQAVPAAHTVAPVEAPLEDTPVPMYPATCDHCETSILIPEGFDNFVCPRCEQANKVEWGDDAEDTDDREPVERDNAEDSAGGGEGGESVAQVGGDESPPKPRRKRRTTADKS